VIPVPPLRDRPDRDRSARDEVRAGVLDGRRHGDRALALEALKAYDWPGNVRELRNVIERAVVLSGGATIEPHHLPDRILERAPESVAKKRPLDVRQRVADVERDTIVSALEKTKVTRPTPLASSGCRVRPDPADGEARPEARPR